MKKVLSTLSAALITANAFAIGSSGSRVDFGCKGTAVQVPLLLGLLIATISCFWMSKTRMAKETRHELWLGILGVIGVIFILGNIW